MRRSSWILGVLAVTLTSGCVEDLEPNEAEFEVTIASPENNAVMLEGEYVHLQASVKVISTSGADVSSILDDTVIVWYSDIVGVLSRETGDCAPFAEETEAHPEDEEDAHANPCWLVYPSDLGGQRVWSLVTRLPDGDHVLYARAVDTLGGRAAPAEATAVVTSRGVSPPEIHLVEPADGAEIEVGTDFSLGAWISDDIDDEIEVTWSSSLQGMISQESHSSPDVYGVDGHAAGEPTDADPCHLNTGTHVMVLSAMDGDGWTSHSFLTLSIVAPEPADGT